VTLEVFFDKQDIMCHKFVPEGASINKEKTVLEAVHVRHSKMWEAKDWVFLCNSVLGNQTSVVQMQLMRCGTVVLPAPSCMLYMKDHQKSFCFKDAGDIQVAMKRVLH
jgi:hypothetical protein